MNPKEYMRKCGAYFIIAATIAHPTLDNAIHKEHIHELHKPQIVHEQRIETPEHLRKEALRDMSKTIKDVAKDFLKAKEKHDRSKEITERSKSPPYSYSDSPPPTEQEMADNLRELQEEYSPKIKDLQSLKHEVSYMEKRLNEYRDNEAKIVELKSNRQNFQNVDSQIKSLGNSCERVHEFFKREYNVEPKNAHKIIEEKRAQITARERELKPTEEKIKILKEQLKERRDAGSQNKENIAKTYE